MIKSINTIKSKYKSQHDFLMDNWKLFVFLPTLFGGLWQLLELAFIHTSFIRFFSISQLVADGLLITFIVAVIYLSVAFAKFIFEVFTADKFNPNGKVWLRLIILFLIYVAIYFIFCHYLLIKLFSYQNLVLFEVVRLIWGFTIVLNLFFGLFKDIDDIIKKRWPNYEDGYDNFLKLLLIVTACFMVYLSISLLQSLKKEYRSPDLLLNNKNIRKSLSAYTNVDSSEYEILYYNDKYIFIELENVKKGLPRNKVILEFSDYFK